ncbi:hypothetical protein OY671_009176 [Metschnikowia pulcherrima]|nr:hypothetical protein OY671_009176 [Metschnikowia pulcherrima]
MQSSQHTDFGSRSSIVLARREGEAVSVPAFAAEQGLSPHHVAKVAQASVHEGFARSSRGRGGGIASARPADGINVGAVVRASERGMKSADCARCASRADCTSSGVSAEASEAFLAVLNRYSSADIARPGAPAFAPWSVAEPAARPCG